MPSSYSGYFWADPNQNDYPLRKLSIVLVLAIVIFLFVALFYIMSDVMGVKEEQASLLDKQKMLERINLASQVENHTQVRLSNRMSFLQLYTEKMGLAGQAKNWPLASYYAGLVSQELDAIQRMDAVYQKRTINTFLEGTTLQQIDELSKSTSGPSDTFDASYKRFVNSCNACHQSTGAGFIKVKVPKGDPFVGMTFKASE